MASKKDKGNIESKALVLKPESTVTTSSLISSVDWLIGFFPFSPELPVSYSSTLISPYNPFADFSQKSKVPYIDYKNHLLT
jgi:hypothetical protein